jgi:glycosyltransferase involved in cell wall biosynthesis
MAAADLFVHPNPHEPFGIAPLEAMAAGVPLVAPRAGGLLTYASDQTAWLAAPCAEGLATAVRQAMSDRAARDKKAALARQTAAAMTLSAASERMLQLHERLHEERCRPSQPAPARISPAHVW